MKTIYLFDVDGTLTPAKSRMDKTFAKEFQEWQEDKLVYIVSGGSFPRIIEQLGSKVYMALGKEDNIIDPEKTIEWMYQNDELDFNPNNTYFGDYGHRTPLVEFKKVFNKLNLKKLQLC